MLILAQLVVAVWTILGVAPVVSQTSDQVIHLSFDRGAERVCVYLRREEKQTPDATWPDGYYTPSSCAPVDRGDEEWQTDVWERILPWFEQHHIPPAEWTIWGEVEYPISAMDLADGERDRPRSEIRRTNELKVTR